jgi:Pentapeptide repeats (8 copies)
LRWLETYQPYMPPYQPDKPGRGDLNFSRASLVNLDLTQLKLYAPKFVEAVLFNVTLNEAKLPNVSFSDSHIVNSHFEQASLDFAQFTRADIRNTSFAKANLYRATFNQAALCKVDFSGADLRKTWFRDVEFDKDFAQAFKNEPWWLALGWSKDQIEALSGLNMGDVKDTVSFEKDMNRANDSLDAAKPGTFDRAIALNVMAWTRATYGLIQRDPEAPGKIEPRCLKEKELDEEDRTVCGGCLTSNDIPDNALDAAEQAICIVKSLNRPEDRNASYGAVEKLIKDTLAYILMQSDRKNGMKEAAAYLAEVLKDPTPPGESIFRDAVVQFSLAKDEPDQEKQKTEEAIKHLKIAMMDRDYVPSHELHTLKKQMKGEFWNELLGEINRVNPANSKNRCPAGGG